MCSLTFLCHPLPAVSCDRVCISGSEYSVVVAHARLASGCWGSHPAVVTCLGDGLHSLPGYCKLFPH